MMLFLMLRRCWFRLPLKTLSISYREIKNSSGVISVKIVENIGVEFIYFTKNTSIFAERAEVKAAEQQSKEIVAEASKVDEQTEEKKEEDEEGMLVNISTFALIRAIEKGRDGFGKNAVLNWQNLKLYATNADNEADMSTLDKMRELARKFRLECIGKIGKFFKFLMEMMTKMTERMKNKLGATFGTKEQREKLLSDDKDDRAELDSTVARLRRELNESVAELTDTGKRVLEDEAQRQKTEERERKTRDRLQKLKEMQVHPFDFLETVLTAVSIAVMPSDERFFGRGKVAKTKHEKLNEQQYEKLMRAREQNSGAGEQTAEVEGEFAKYEEDPEFNRMLEQTKGCWRLKHTIEQAIFKNDALQNDVVYKDLRGRIGAQVNEK